ncbi:MAG: SMC family ATPase [Chloroflexi bacterium]|nr:SMC family ATPase [Chloroflexota bacterium]
MIPLRLALKNFMSYRGEAPVLDLEGIHVACLCGDNGHGKTALLDAITWALWGQARARTQEELVHQGQTDMSVELDFAAQGQRYRVSRSHSRSVQARQGKTDFNLFVSSGNGFRAISEESIRGTQAKLEEILHLDYETFINTAFLRQGDADRFTTSRPAERKATLAQVLDLSYYDRLEERARTRSRAIREDIVGLDTEISLGRQEIDRRPEYEERLASVSEALASLGPEVEALQAVAQNLRRSVEGLRESGLELDKLVQRLPELEVDVSRLETQMKRHESRVVDFETALGRRFEIDEGYAKLEETRARLAQLEQALARSHELGRAKGRLEQELAVQGARLSAELNQLRKTLAEDLEPRANTLDAIESEVRDLERERNAHEGLEADVGRSQREGQEAAARVQYLEQANAVLKAEMEESREKFDMLERGDTVCPLCNQPLGAEGKEHLRAEYRTLGLERKQRHEDNSREREALEASGKKIAQRLSQMAGHLTRERQRVDGRLAVLQRQRAESLEARASAGRVSAELQRVDSTIASGDFALDERAALAALEEETSALGYDAAEHQLVRGRGVELEPYAELHRRLADAAEGLPLEHEALQTARELVQGRQAELKDALRRRITLEGELRELPARESQLREADGRLGDTNERRDAALVEQGVLAQQMERCDELARDIAKKERRRVDLSDESRTYDELARAFGKNGIQAFIIESAIPGLESDANELLGRLTENRMHLRLQLLEGRRDGRTGLASEELDIKIADEVGTRSYETFSGGEAFRINFALRIALSKLLARRSGAPLPILFIDEGFGSQDTAGQERLTEAIQSIQDDFEKIIVITHVDQIKEAFPVRIEVTKDSNGSTFRLV